jgi:hypothetical protein
MLRYRIRVVVRCLMICGAWPCVCSESCCVVLHDCLWLQMCCFVFGWLHGVRLLALWGFCFRVGVFVPCGVCYRMG